MFSKSIYKLCALLLISGVMLLVCCTERNPERNALTVSIPQQKFLLESIVGDKYKVRSLLSNGGDPETYDPTMTNLLNIERSMAYFRVGGIGFEDAIAEKIRVSCPNLPMIDTSVGIERIVGSHGSETEEDPHVWTSVPNAKIMASNMLEALRKLDQPNIHVYEKNYKALVARLDSVEAVLQGYADSAPSKAFVVWHPSLSYFARDYGLTQIALGSENKEMSANSIRTQIDLAKSSGAKVLFTQKDIDARQVEVIEKELGLPSVAINPMAEDWMGEMLTIGAAIANPENNGK